MCSSGKAVSTGFPPCSTCSLGSVVSWVFYMLVIITGEKLTHVLCCCFLNLIPCSLLCSQVVYNGWASFGKFKGFARQLFLCCCRTGDFQIHSLLEGPKGPQWGPTVSATCTFPLNKKIYPSSYQSINLSSAYLSFIYLSIHPSIYLSIYLYI